MPKRDKLMAFACEPLSEGNDLCPSAPRILPVKGPSTI